MPISNEVIPQIGGPVAQAEPLSIDTQGLDRALTNLAGVGSDLLVEKRKSELQSALDAEEGAFNEELRQLVHDRDTTATQDTLSPKQTTFDGDPRVAQMMQDLRKQDNVAEQGLISSSRLGVRKEAIFREYAAKYPRLIPDFLKQATSSGLGGTSSLYTQEMIDYLNDGAVKASADAKARAAASQSYYEEIVKNSRLLGIEPPPPSAGDEQVASWLTVYNEAADLHETYKRNVESSKIYLNNAAVSKDQATQYVNSQFSKNYGSMTTELKGELDAGMARLLGVNDIGQLADLAGTVDLEKAHLEIQNLVTQWKQKLMNRMGASGVVGSKISASDWSANFAGIDKFAEGYLALIGTKQVKEKASDLKDLIDLSVRSKADPRRVATAELLQRLGGNNIVAAQYNNQLSRDIALALRGSDTVNSSILSESGAAPQDQAPLMNSDGTVNPMGWNALEAARNDRKFATKLKQEEAAGGYLVTTANILNNPQALPNATPETLASAKKGAASQAISITNTLHDEIVKATKEKRQFLPADLLMNNLVSTLASTGFEEQYKLLPPEQQQFATEVSGPVLTQELAYLARLTSSKLGEFASGTKAGATAGATAALSAYDAASAGYRAITGQGETPKPYAGSKEYFTLNVNPTSGTVTLSLNEDIKADLSTNEQAQARKTMGNFNTTTGKRIGNAIHAMMTMGFVDSYEAGLEFVTSTEGFPQHIVQQDKGTNPAVGTKAQQDAVRAAQKKARGE